MIGRRLRQARSAAGLSLRDLETRIGKRVTAQAINKYERDESMPSSGVLITLAGALDVSVDYLTGDPEIVLDAVEFRKKKLTRRWEEAHVEARVIDRMERYLTVEELLGMPSVAWDAPRETPYPVVNHVGDAEHAARGLRTHWALGVDPIPNLVELLEGRGIKVLFIDLTDIDGLTARVRRGNRNPMPVVVVNRATWGERQRFTLAHELGHMALDVAPGVDAEKAAHRFAGAFLMPREALWTEIGKHRRSIGWGELFELKQIFGVSVQALTMRGRDLGIFGAPLVRRLFQEFKKRGWRDPPYEEPDALKREEPRRFERLCFRALAEDAVSETRAAELLGITVHELNRRMEEPPDAEHAAHNRSGL